MVGMSRRRLGSARALFQMPCAAQPCPASGKWDIACSQITLRKYEE